MKHTHIWIFLAAAGLMAACNPIEDDSLRDKYYTNAGDPITPEELTKALIVEQPYSNTPDAVEGDQIIHIRNVRPEIGGVWHIGNRTYITDDRLITLESNGIYEITYVAVHNNAVVRSNPITVMVTNVLNENIGHLTGAKDKADMTAQKRWHFRQGLAAVCDMCAHGFWKYPEAGYTPESFAGITWWGAVTFEKAGDQTMLFELAGTKFSTFNADGSARGTGVFDVSSDAPEAGVVGVLSTTAPLIGSQYDDLGQGSSNSFYILRLTDQYLTVYHTPATPGGDWDDSGWRAVYEAELTEE